MAGMCQLHICYHLHPWAASVFLISNLKSRDYQEYLTCQPFIEPESLSGPTQRSIFLKPQMILSDPNDYTWDNCSFSELSQGHPAGGVSSWLTLGNKSVEGSRKKSLSIHQVPIHLWLSHTPRPSVPLRSLRVGAVRASFDTSSLLARMSWEIWGEERGQYLYIKCMKLCLAQVIQTDLWM